MNSQEKALSERLELAIEAAREAGRHTLSYFQRDSLQVDRKSDDSPVTVADREAEQLLRQRISVEFPDDAILGEEFGEQPGTSGFRWILDPIDGTKSFIHGVPLFTNLVGVEWENDSAIGVINVPALDECAYAAKGRGAWHLRGDEPPKPARVSTCEQLDKGLFLTSEPEGFANRGVFDTFRQLVEAAWLTRTWGDAYGYFLVATGRAEAMVDPILEVWDAAALKPVIEEAGGVFTDFKGDPTIYNREAIGSNGLVHNQVLAITRQVSGDEGRS